MYCTYWYDEFGVDLDYEEYRYPRLPSSAMGRHGGIPSESLWLIPTWENFEAAS